MKKKWLIFLSTILIMMDIIWTLYNTKTVTYQVLFVDELPHEETKTINICLQNEEGLLEVVTTEVPSNLLEEDEYLSIIKLYDDYRNALSKSYKSPLVQNITIEQLTVDNLVMDIKVGYIDSYTNVITLLTAWMWTFQNYGIEKINVKFANRTFTITKNCIINAKNSSGKHMIVLYNKTEHGYIPISSFYNDDADDITAMVDNLFTMLNIDDVDYNIEKSEVLKIYLDDEKDKFNASHLEQLIFNLERSIQNGENQIVIIKNDSIIYQQ